VWAVGLGVRTVRRQGDWLDQRTFFNSTIREGGDSARMHVNLGNLEANEGRPDRAMMEYQAALDRRPNLAFALYAITGLQMKQGDFGKARATLEQALQQPGFEAEGKMMRGALDYAEKKIDPTPIYREAAEKAPLNWTLRRRYLTALAQTGHLQTATEELRRFLEEQDFRADSWALMAEFLTQEGLPELAAAAREEARKRDVRLP